MWLQGLDIVGSWVVHNLIIIHYLQFSIFLIFFFFLQENGITGETYTYDQVITKTLKTASALKKAGYRAGDTVAIFIRNSPEYLIIILAASALGLVISTVNSSYTSCKYQIHFSYFIWFVSSKFVIILLYFYE